MILTLMRVRIDKERERERETRWHFEVVRCTSYKEATLWIPVSRSVLTVDGFWKVENNSIIKQMDHHIT